MATLDIRTGDTVSQYGHTGTVERADNGTLYAACWPYLNLGRPARMVKIIGADWEHRCECSNRLEDPSTRGACEDCDAADCFDCDTLGLLA